MKTEPSTFSFDDLVRAPRSTTGWTGVRNYQARNLMRDEMRVGDRVFIYHSSTDEPGVVGIAEVTSPAYADPTALDKKDAHYDEKSDPRDPTWMMVDVRAIAALKAPVSLATLRATPAVAAMALLRKGNRLSVQPVSADEWAIICRMGGIK